MPLFVFSCMNAFLCKYFIHGDFCLMSNYAIADCLRFGRKTIGFVLAFFGLCGIVLGVLTSYSVDPYLFSAMRRSSFRSVSIIGLITAAWLPFLISAIFVSLSKLYLFIPLSFIKSFSYAFVRSFVAISFLQAGWLAASILLFSDTIVICLLYWYWIRQTGNTSKTAVKDLFICLFISLIACIIDYFWVSNIL